MKKDANGKEKDVQIDTPVASLHVNKEVSATDTGLPVYPGSHRVEEALSDNNEGATVNVLTGIFGMKVTAVKYETDDPVDKVKDYYRSQLQKYGNYIECKANTIAISPGAEGDSNSKNLVCEQTSGDNIELKAGTPHNQHAVAIEPLDKGSRYALVYLQIHEKKDTI